MLQDNFNKDFTRAFTQDCILYSATEEYRHGNLLFMQFVDTMEMKAIAISVSKNIYQGQLVSCIIKEIEMKSIPQIASLCVTTNQLINEFNTYILHEPHTSGYCNELIHTLESFQQLAKDLNKEVCEQLANKLRDLHAGIYNSNLHVDIDGFYFYPAIDKIEYYLKNLLTYYYHFLIIKQQENDNCKGIGLTTQVSDFLWELTGAIEMVSDNIEDILDMLLTWEVHMELCEEHALYN